MYYNAYYWYISNNDILLYTKHISISVNIHILFQTQEETISVVQQHIVEHNRKEAKMWLSTVWNSLTCMFPGCVVTGVDPK